MREKIARFMQGRYGVDELARFLTGLSMVWIVLELITRNRFFEILFWVTVVWLYYRILSRDYGKRQQENSKFLTLRYRFTSKWNQWIHPKGYTAKGSRWEKLKYDLAQKKAYHIYAKHRKKQHKKGKEGFYELHLLSGSLIRTRSAFLYCQRWFTLLAISNRAS